MLQLLIIRYFGDTGNYKNKDNKYKNLKVRFIEMKEKNAVLCKYLSNRNICIVLSILSTCSLTKMVKSNDLYSASNSMFSIIVCVGIYFLLKRAIIRADRRLCTVSLILGFLFSAFMLFGRNILVDDTTKIDGIGSWLTILFGSPFFAAIIAIILKELPRYFDKSNTKSFFKYDINDKKMLGIYWVIIFIAWVPALIASFPGVYGYDSIYQMKYYNEGHIFLHYPLAHTYMLGFFVKEIGDLLGSVEAGFLCYSLFQMAFLSYVFAKIGQFLYRKKVATGVRTLVVIMFMFHPINSIMSFSSTKDVVFSGLFALLILLLIKLTENTELLNSKKFCVIFSLVSLAFIAFRSQGKYVFVFGMLLTIFLLRKYWKKLTILFISIIVLTMIYSGPVTTLLNGIAFDGTVEMMSVPCMQLSRCMLYNSDRLTDEEKEMIEEYVSAYEYYSICPGISDGMKASFNVKLYKKDKLAFFKFWAKLGLKYPVDYIDAFARLTIGYWYPDMNYRDIGAYHPYWEYESTKQNDENEWVIVERHTPAFAQPLADFFYKLTYENTYQELPIVSMFFSSGIITWFVFIYMAWCIYVKQYKYLVPLTFILGLWGTLMLGPVVLYRYIYPIAVCIPLLFAVMLSEEKKS